MRDLVLAQSARIADFIPAIAFVLLLARTLGPTDFGAYSICFNVAFISSSVLPPSLMELFGRHLPSREFRGRSVARLALRYRLPFAGFGAILTIVVIQTAGLGDAVLTAVAFAAFLSLELIGYSQAAAAGLLAYGTLLRWRIIGRVVSLTAAILLAVTGVLDPGTSLMALALGQAVTGLGTMRAIWLPMSSLGANREIQANQVRRFGLETWAAAVLTIGLGTQKDVLILGMLGVGAKEVGVYSVAATLSTQLALLLTGGWVPASLPILTRHRTDPAAFAIEWSRLVRGWALIVAPAFVALAMGATQLVPILFGASYESASGPLVVFALGYSLTALVGGAVNQLALYARDASSAVLESRFIAFAINIVLAIALIPRYEALGAAAATAFAVIVVFALEYARLKALFGLRLPMRNLGAILIATLISTAAAVLIGLSTRLWLLACVAMLVGFAALAIALREIDVRRAGILWLRMRS